MRKCTVTIIICCLCIHIAARSSIANDKELKDETIKPWVVDSCATDFDADDPERTQPKRNSGIGELLLKPGPKVTAFLESHGIEFGDKPNWYSQISVNRVGDLGYQPNHNGVQYWEESPKGNGYYCDLKSRHIKEDKRIFLTIDYMSDHVCHRFDVEIEIDLPQMIDVDNYLSVEQLRKSSVTWVYRGEVEWVSPNDREEKEEE